uniref:Uncharacterized protein n=1 Tax=Trichuris muris TaxID=70415 RepID=A0A5S6QXH2_TRIMR
MMIIVLLVVVLVLSFLYLHLCDLVHGFFLPAARGADATPSLKAGAEPPSEKNCPPTPNPTAVSSVSQDHQALRTAEWIAMELGNSERTEVPSSQVAIPVPEKLNLPAAEKAGIPEAQNVQAATSVPEKLNLPVAEKPSGSTPEAQTPRKSMQTAKDALSETSEMRISRCPSVDEDLGKKDKFVLTTPVLEGAVGSPEGVSAKPPPPTTQPEEKLPNPSAGMKTAERSDPDRSAAKEPAAVGATQSNEKPDLQTAQVEVADPEKLAGDNLGKPPGGA